MTPDLVEKAVWLCDLVRVRNVVQVLTELYDSNTWVGGMVFQDTRSGFLLVATFDRDRYAHRLLPFDIIFEDRDLRSITLAQAMGDHRRYRPFVGGDIPNTLRAVKLLPV